jgi:hypothetical protein
MTSHVNEKLARLRALSDGAYEPPPTPPIDLNHVPLFAGLARTILDGPAVEIAPGVELRRTFAYVFAPSMVALSPKPNPRAPHPTPWYAVEGGGDAETVEVEVAIAEGVRPFGLPRLAALRLIASVIRLVSAQPVCMPLMCNVPLAEAKRSSEQVKMWSLERRLALFCQPVTLTESFNRSLADFLPHVDALSLDADLARAFSLADGMWWLPSLEAQMTTIWTAIEMLMRPGRKNTTKQLGRAVRAYTPSTETLVTGSIKTSHGSTSSEATLRTREPSPLRGTSRPRMESCGAFFSVRFRNESGRLDPKTSSHCGLI